MTKTASELAHLFRALKAPAAAGGERSRSRSHPAAKRAAELLEDCGHYRSVHGLNSRPNGARNEVLVLHENTEEEGVLASVYEQFRWHPDARAGGEEREVRGASRHFPALSFLTERPIP